MEIIKPITLAESVSIPWARDIFSLAPVDLNEQPISVPKNQYNTPIVTATKISTMIIGFREESSLTYLEDTKSLYLSTEIGRLEREPISVPKPIICRLIEYKPS